MESTTFPSKCMICDESNCLTYINETLKILTCAKCNVIYNEHEFTEKIFENKVFPKPPLLKLLFHKLTHVRLSQNMADEYVKYLKSKTKMNFKNVLEIGANYGCLVNNLNKLGIEAHGIESDQQFIEFAVTKNIQQGHFDKNYVLNEKYDLICLTQMIYFMRDNYAILKHVKSMLNPNGCVFISTRRGKLKAISSLGGNKRENISTNMILSKKNYESICNKLGLEVIDNTFYTSELGKNKSNLIRNKLSYLQFIFNLKRQTHPDKDGDLSFILLKNS